MSSSNLIYYLHRKSSRAIFLITLLILPSFPEKILGNAAYYHHQQHRKPLYYSVRTNTNGTAELLKGNPRRLYPTTPTMYTSLVPLSPSRYRQPPRQQLSMKQRNALPQNQDGTVNLHQVSSLPPQYMGRLPPTTYGPLPNGPLRPTKLKSKQYAYPIAMKKHCPGRKNLLDDIGILSLITAIMSSSFGMYTILVNSMTSNNIGIVSGFMSLLLWVPSTIITLFNLSGDHIYTIGNFVNSMSFINSMYGFMGVLFGTADVLSSAAGESVGVISFILSVIATFPDFLDKIIEYLYRVGDRRSLEHYVENYGCSVPGLFRTFGKPIYHVVNDFLVASIETKGIE